jgi:hypothetical protein
MTEKAPSADLKLGSTEGSVDAPTQPEPDARIGPIAPRRRWEQRRFARRQRRELRKLERQLVGRRRWWRRRTVPAPEPHLSRLDAAIAAAVENAARAEREQLRREAEDAVERRVAELRKTMEVQQQESMNRMWHVLTRRMERRIAQRTDGAAEASRGPFAPKRPKESAGRDSARTKGH